MVHGPLVAHLAKEDFLIGIGIFAAKLVCSFLMVALFQGSIFLLGWAKSDFGWGGGKTGVNWGMYR